MRCSIAAVLATFLAGQAAAVSIKHGHQHLHTKKEAQPSPMEVGVAKRQSIAAADVSRLTSLSVLPGLNAVAAGASAWIGTGGAYTNTFTNNAGEDLIVVIWGPAGSWVNVNVPLVTLSLASGAVETVSFATGLSGAWSAIYSDTETVDGQVSNTWGEFTFGPTGVVDVSREVNMAGHGMIVNGPTCTTDMDTCVFVCSTGNTCLTDYELLNCDNGSQTGATYGTFGGYPSGGCGWNGADSAALETQFY